MPEHILSGASLVDNRQVCSCGRVFYDKEEALHHLISNPITNYAGIPVIGSTMVPKGQIVLASDTKGLSEIFMNTRDLDEASKAWEAAAFARLQQQLAKAARPHYKPKRKWYFLWLR